MSDQRVSSRGLWRTFHVQPPSRLGKARFYLASRQPVELPIPPSTHLLGKYSQIQGFITRTKAEPHDQIAGDCCDLLSRRVKEWQSHRGARCRSGSRNLDVAPSRLATRTLPGQCDKGASKNSALNSNNQAQSPSSPHSPCLRFRSRRSRRLDFAAASLTLSACVLSGGGPLGLDRKGFDAARSSYRLRVGSLLWRVPLVTIHSD